MEPLPPERPLHWRRCGHWQVGLALAAGLQAVMMVSTDPITSCGGGCNVPGLAEAILETDVDENVEVVLTIGLQGAIEATGVVNLVDVSMLIVSDFPHHGKINTFLDKAHAFFLRYLAGSPRAIVINAAPDEDKHNFLEALRKCYIARSQSVQYMNTRLGQAKIIAKELVAQNIDYRDLMPVRVAAYINKRTVGLSHDKAYNLANTVRYALRWLE